MCGMCGMCGDYPQGKMFTHKLEPPTTTLADAKEHAERLTRECLVDRAALAVPAALAARKDRSATRRTRGISDEAPSLHQLGFRS
jgi:hypothetical protein